MAFRWVDQEELGISSVRAIEDGFRGEALMAEHLRRVPGVELLTKGEDGEQFEVVAHGGHMKGHLDGAILGLLQAPKTWHVWEHKQVNEKKFTALRKARDEHGEKGALEAWNPIFYVQAQLYMRGTGMTRHYMTVGTPGLRDVLSCRTEYDEAKAAKFEQRSGNIIFAAEPPQRISDDAAFWLCKFCVFHSQCHGQQAPLPTCRSCAHSTPERDGSWRCEWKGVALDVEAQQAGCDDHRPIPALVASFLELVTAEGNVVDWRNKLNGALVRQPDYSSREIRNATDKAFVGDDFVKMIKTTFPGARVVPSEPRETSPGEIKDDLPWINDEPDDAARGKDGVPKPAGRARRGARRVSNMP